MKFKEIFPDYKSFTDTEDYYYKSVPSSFWSGMSGLISACANFQSAKLKTILNSFAAIIPCDNTTDWSWDVLIANIDYYVREIRKKVDTHGRIDILMDCLAVMVGNDEDHIESLNELLEYECIGYECYMHANGYYDKRIMWRIREKELVVDTLTSTKEILKSNFQQAYEEYDRAVAGLKDADNERARKDIVRSCVSAMESIVKICGKANDIGQATRNLKNDDRWGKWHIIRQGDAIFHYMHELYPDLRHGSLETSEMTIAETKYWVEAISSYIHYMKEMADKNGIK